MRKQGGWMLIGSFASSTGHPDCARLIRFVAGLRSRSDALRHLHTELIQTKAEASMQPYCSLYRQYRPLPVCLYRVPNLELASVMLQLP